VSLLFEGIAAQNPFIHITPQALLAAEGGFNVDNITSVSFIADVSIQQNKGMITVVTKNIEFTPVVDRDFTKPLANLPGLPGSLSSQLIKDPEATNASTLSASVDNRGVVLNYDNQANEFSAGAYTYDDFSTDNTLETFDLSATNELVFGLTGDLNQVVMEIVSCDTAACGQNEQSRDQVILNGVSSAMEQVWTVATALFDDVDLEKVLSILFLAPENTQGRLEVNHLKPGQSIITPGPILPTAGLTAADLSLVPDLPRVVTTSGNVDRVSNDQVDVAFNPAGGGGAFIISQDDIETPFATELSTFPNVLTVGASCEGTCNQMQLIIEDGAGNILPLTLLVTDTLGFYEIDIDGQATANGVSIDHAAIKSLTVQINGSQNGTLHFHLDGLDPLPPLSAELEASRRNWMDDQLQYLDGGMDPATGFIYDQRMRSDGTPGEFTALTNIAFQLQILGEVTRGSIKLPGVGDPQAGRTDALLDLVNLMDNLGAMQAADSFNGLLPTVYELGPLEPNDDSLIAFFDNANLTQSIAVLVAILESLTTLTAVQEAIATDIIAAATAFINAQQAGYTAFYDPAEGLFHAARDINTGQFIVKPVSGDPFHIDRLGSEARSGVAFVVTQFGLPVAAWNNLVATTGDYEDTNGVLVDLLKPFDGGAFQMFWPLMWSNETNQATMQAALQNFFYAATDFANFHQLPGFPSAGPFPEGGYEGKIGIPDAAEAVAPPFNDVIIFNVAYVYALAGAFVVNPAIVMEWMKAIRDQYSNLITPFGFVDGFRSEDEISMNITAIDQMSTVLGLLGSGGKFMDMYLADRNLTATYNGLYDSLNLGLDLFQEGPVGPPPEFPLHTFTVLNNLAGEGSLGATQFEASTPFGTHIHYTGDNSNFGGRFWVLDQVYDARVNDLVISYSGDVIPAQATIELKDTQNNIVATIAGPIENGPGLNTIVVPFSADAPLENVKIVSILLNPSVTGPNADFFVNQITFRQMPAQAALLQAILTGLATTTRGRNFDTILNFRFLQLQQQGNLVSASVNLPETDFSFDTLIFGFKSNKDIERLEIELEDGQGNVTTGFVTGVQTGTGYYEVLVDFVPLDMDFSKIRKVNVIIDKADIEGPAAAQDLQIEIGLV
jgi:hypothetical protein